MKLSPIFITGMGIVSSVGVGCNTFTNALREGKNNITLSKRYSELNFPLLQAELSDFDFKANLNSLKIFSELQHRAIQSVRRSRWPIQAGVCASLEAWQQASLHERKINHAKIGVILAGHNTTSVDHFQQFQSLEFVNPSYALQFMDNHQLAIISEILHIQGPGITLGAASASSHAALWQAYYWLQGNLVDACLVIGALAELSVIELQAFANLGALGGRSFVDNPKAASRPFDQAHEGFIPGQAAAAIILENATSMNQDSIQPQAELVSVALNLDASRLSNPNLEGEMKAMQHALEKASLQSSEIDYVNAHGTSTPLGDITELQAIEKVIGTKAWVNSTKAIIGHCLWSAGMVETIATVIQMQQSFVHANPNTIQPIKTGCHLVGTQAQPKQINYAMNNGFGFGGVNSSLILAKTF